MTALIALYGPGGHILASCGHWKDLSKLHVTEKNLLRVRWCFAYVLGLSISQVAGHMYGHDYVQHLVEGLAECEDDGVDGSRSLE